MPLCVTARNEAVQRLFLGCFVVFVPNDAKHAEWLLISHFVLHILCNFVVFWADFLKNSHFS